MNVDNTETIKLTQMQFCNEVGIQPDNYIFKDMPDNSKYYYMHKGVKEPARYFFSNGKIIREFKHMKEYEETWMRTLDITQEKPKWSLWTVWKVWY